MSSTSPTKMHVALHTAHFAESVEFYETFFGETPVKHKAGYAKFDLDAPALNLTLTEVRSVVPGALSHLGIQVESTEAVLATRRALEARGVVIDKVEMGTECCYAVQDKFWVKDPNGLSWEVFYVKVGDTRPDLESKVSATNRATSATCCAPASNQVDATACCTPASNKVEASACCTPANVPAGAPE